MGFERSGKISCLSLKGTGKECRGATMNYPCFVKRTRVFVEKDKNGGRTTLKVITAVKSGRGDDHKWLYIGVFRCHSLNRNSPRRHIFECLVVRK